MKAGDKYKISSQEKEGRIIPNKMNIADLDRLEIAEAEGFVTAQIDLRSALNPGTRFDLNYVMRIHKLALGHLYEFAGKPRTVDMSKGGFAFPSALHLPATLQSFERNMLLRLPASYTNMEELIEDIAKIHAELLFIHPFREGNGRTARILANLMAEKEGYGRLLFEKFETEEMFSKYIIAVQQAGMENYEPMKILVGLLFQP